MFGIRVLLLTTTKTNWNQPSEGLLDGLIFSDYRRTSSVSSMLQQLSWPSLHIRRKISRLQLFHKIFHHQTSLLIPIYYLPVTRDNTRHYHPNQFIFPPVSTTSHGHLQSFFSRTIKEWNNLTMRHSLAKYMNT